VHLVGFIIKKFVTMHGHMNVKFLGAFVSESTGITFLISKDEVNFMMSPRAPLCVPRHHFQNFKNFFPFCDHHAAVRHPVFETNNSIPFIIPS
jgi:hypothetical protein